MIEIPCKISPHNVIAVRRPEQAFYAALAPSCWVVMYTPEQTFDPYGNQYMQGVTLTEQEAEAWEDSVLTFDPQAHSDVRNS